MRDIEVYGGAVLIGALAGMRSMAAPAVLGRLSKDGALAKVSGPLALVKGSKLATTSTLLAAGELIADKLPFAPNRTDAGPLIGRAVVGGLSGAVVCSAKRKSPLLGALLGASAAIGSAWAAYTLRKRAVSTTKIPDSIIALGEDAVVGALGAALSTRFTA